MVIKTSRPNALMRNLPRSSARRIGPAQQGLSRRYPEAHDDFWLRQLQFSDEPGAAGGDLTGQGFFMFSPISLRFPFEMFYSVRHIYRGHGDTGLLERLPQYSPGGTDKRPSHLIFLVPRLFSHQDNGSLLRTFTKDGLSRALIEIAALTVGRRFFQGRQCQCGWQKVRSRSRSGDGNHVPRDSGLSWRAGRRWCRGTGTLSWQGPGRRVKWRVQSIVRRTRHPPHGQNLAWRRL